MGKLRDAVNKQYFTEKRMIELAKKAKNTQEIVASLDLLSESIERISDTLASNNYILECKVEEDNIEDIEATEQIISIIEKNIPTKEINALAKKLSAEKKETKIDEEKVLKSLGIKKA